MPVKKLNKNEIRKDGRAYVFRVSEYGLDGKRHQYKSPAYMTFEEAQEAEKKYLNKYKGVEVNQHITFGQAFDKVYEYKQDKIKQSTLKTYLDRKVYMNLLWNVEIVDLNENLYQKWRNQMNKTNLCDRYKNDIQKMIKIVLNYAEKHWDFNLRKFYNKLEPYKTPGALKKEMVYYTPQEFYKFIDIVDDIRFKCLFKTLYYCGLRRGEARGLQWKHIDLFNKKLHVKQQVMNPSTTNNDAQWFISNPKTNSSIRTLPISDDLINDLTELKNKMKFIKKFNENWFVFGDDRPITIYQMDSRNRKYSLLAGVKRINIHGFRHSCASVLIHGKTPITVVSNYLGHADSTETLETYAHMFEDDLNDVPKYIDNMLDDLAKKFTNPIEAN